MNPIDSVESLVEKDRLVLIVDDMKTNRRILGEMIAKLELEVIYAVNGLEAIEKYREHLPSLVLMDINMPVMDGIESAKQIKLLAKDNFIPIIFISAELEQQVIRDASVAGGDDFIQRPFPSELLRGKVIALRRIVGLYRQVKRLNDIREHEAELAEQLLSNAIGSDNVAQKQIHIHKQPAEVFSGDVQLSAFRPNGDLNVLLGDFTGHGLTSALGALPLSETFRAMTSKGYEAEEILAQVNRKLYRLLPTGLFLAAAIVTMSAEGNVRIWNGGLPDVMLFRKGELMRRFVSSHPPLGILSHLNGMRFEMCNVEPADHLLMVSDGVLEALNEEGEMFGEDRLIRAVTLSESLEDSTLIESVINTLEQFTDGQEQGDDISLIDVPGFIVNEDPTPVVAADMAVREKGLSHDVWNWSVELQGKSLARINPVAQALSRLQEAEGKGEHWNNVFSILTELYINALDHGVLQLDSRMKDSPGGFTLYFKEREKRLETLLTGSVSVHLQHMRLPWGGRLQIRIDDSGSGFNYQRWLDQNTDAEGSRLSGRGILLVSELCKNIKYLNDGASVEVVYVYSIQEQNT